MIVSFSSKKGTYDYIQYDLVYLLNLDYYENVDEIFLCCSTDSRYSAEQKIVIYPNNINEIFLSCSPGSRYWAEQKL